MFDNNDLIPALVFLLEIVAVTSIFILPGEEYEFKAFLWLCIPGAPIIGLLGYLLDDF